MDFNCDQDSHLHRRSTLKIRRAPSSKISATSSSSQTCSSSFHGRSSSSSSRRQIIKNTCCTNSVSRLQPLIFHTFDPEIIAIEPAEFMWVVQRLTGSLHTRKLLRMQRSKEIVQSPSRVRDGQLMQQSENDPLKEGTTTDVTPTLSCSNPDLCINDTYVPDFSLYCPNPSEKINLQKPDLLLSSHANYQLNCSPKSSLCSVTSDLSNTNCSYSPATTSLSSDTNQHNLNTNHPASSFSSCSDLSEENTRHSLSPNSSRSCAIMQKSSEFFPISTPSPTITATKDSSSSLHTKRLQKSSPSSPKPNKCRSLIIDNRPLSSSPPNHLSKCEDTNYNPMSAETPPCSPVSPNSSLTTSSEGYHTDYVSVGGASPYRKAFCLEEAGNALIEAEEDGSTIDFFVFSGNSYYGTYRAAQLDEVELH